jgi:predicted nucleic acid-binding protein
MNVFVDTNILLDVLGPRELFYAASSGIWTLAETGRINGYVSALSLPNVFYVIRRSGGLAAAREAVTTVRDVMGVVPLDSLIINQAIDSEMADFEDAIQFFSALRAEATALVTRNPKHFPGQDIPVLIPAEFLSMHFAM